MMAARAPILGFLLIMLGLPSNAATAESLEQCKRAMATHRAGQIDGALNQYTHCIALGNLSGPNLAVAYTNRGNAYRQLGGFGRALDYNPIYAPAFNNRAWTRYLLGDLEEALLDIRQAITYQPQNAAVHDTNAHVLAAIGRYDEAMLAFETAIKFGDTAQVRAYQKKLTLMGFDPGPSDGIYGPETAAALKACVLRECRLWE